MGLSVVVMGILPMIVYATMLWWIDHWEREPVWLVVAAFLWGAVPAVIASTVFQLVTSVALFGSLNVEDLTQLTPELRFVAVFVAPITEECCKGFLLLVLWLLFRREINCLMDGLVYGAIIGFGFAAVENVGYFLAVQSQDPESMPAVVALRAFALGPMHALWTGMTGLGVALARFQRNWALRLLLPLGGLGAAIFLHALHNFLATTGTELGIFEAIAVDWFGVLWIFVLVIVSLANQRRCIVTELQGEVARGVLSDAHANLACNGGLVLLHGLFPFLFWLPTGSAERKLMRLCAKLAFCKRQLGRMGDEGGNTATLERLRNDVSMAGRDLAMRGV